MVGFPSGPESKKETPMSCLVDQKDTYAPWPAGGWKRAKEPVFQLAVLEGHASWSPKYLQGSRWDPKLSLKRESG